MTVSQFYDMVMFNQFHNIYVKSQETDGKIDTIISVEHLENSPFKDHEIKGFATDWETRFYILWV